MAMLSPSIRIERLRKILQNFSPNNLLLVGISTRGSPNAKHCTTTIGTRLGGSESRYRHANPARRFIYMRSEGDNAGYSIYCMYTRWTHQLYFCLLSRLVGFTTEIVGLRCVLKTNGVSIF
jgi:hypothetical protein